MVSQPMIFPIIFIILFIGCFSHGNSIDCGGNLVANTITVDQQNGTFNTIQAAIDSVKSKNDQWIKIHINPGTYSEKVNISKDKPCIILEGSGSDNTIITHGDNYNLNKEIDSSTFLSSPPNVIVTGITFQNTAGPAGGPAVAASFLGDKSAIFNCSFLGYQDTLYDRYGRHYYKNCYIEGEVDFIFGRGQTYFEDCLINATKVIPRGPGYITAQHRDFANQTNGFIFKGGSIVGNGEVNLGRAWGPYARVIFWETEFSSIITDVGWNAWKYPGHEGNFTFAEVDCKGKGARKHKRVEWEKKFTNSYMLKEFSFQSFINNDGWFDNIPTI